MLHIALRNPWRWFSHLLLMRIIYKTHQNTIWPASDFADVPLPGTAPLFRQVSGPCAVGQHGQLRGKRREDRDLLQRRSVRCWRLQGTTDENCHLTTEHRILGVPSLWTHGPMDIDSIQDGIESMKMMDMWQDHIVGDGFSYSRMVSVQ